KKRSTSPGPLIFVGVLAVAAVGLAVMYISASADKRDPGKVSSVVLKDDRTRTPPNSPSPTVHTPKATIAKTPGRGSQATGAPEPLVPRKKPGKKPPPELTPAARALLSKV